MWSIFAFYGIASFHQLYFFSIVLLSPTSTDLLTHNSLLGFYVNIPFGVATITIIVLFLRMPRPKDSIRQKLTRIDYAGSFFLMASTILILLPLQWGGNQYAWNSALVISMFCVGGVLLIGLILVEKYYAKEPLLPGYLLKRRTTIAICIVQFFFGMNFFGGAVYYTPIYFQIARGDSATTSGLEMLPLILAVVVCSTGSGLVASYTGHVRPLVWLGLAIQCVGGGLLSLLKVDSNRGELIGYLLVMGVGCGLCMQTVLLCAQSSVAPREYVFSYAMVLCSQLHLLTNIIISIAVITAITSFFRTVGGVFGIAIFGTVYQNALVTQLESLDLTISAAALAQNFELVKTLPDDTRILVQDAFVSSLDKMRILIVPFAGIAFFVSLFIEHNELRKRPTAKKEEELKIDVKQTDNAETISDKPQVEQVDVSSPTGSASHSDEKSTLGRDDILVTNNEWTHK